MSKRQDEDFFRHLISGMDSKLQTELNWMYAHKRMRDDWERKHEMERMKNEIVNEVLSRISIMFETGEAMQKIKSLNQTIEQLGE